jgi:hypothetical protein
VIFNPHNAILGLGVRRGDGGLLPGSDDAHEAHDAPARVHGYVRAAQCGVEEHPRSDSRGDDAIVQRIRRRQSRVDALAVADSAVSRKDVAAGRSSGRDEMTSFTGVRVHPFTSARVTRAVMA